VGGGAIKKNSSAGRASMFCQLAVQKVEQINEKNRGLGRGSWDSTFNQLDRCHPTEAKISKKGGYNMAFTGET